MAYNQVALVKSMLHNIGVSSTDDEISKVLKAMKLDQADALAMQRAFPDIFVKLL